ncbi:hypothetical protein [Nocardioides antri]|uniref:Tape measure protein n=1 Tax=Nocardioides antri TaxID=2607659 RepID=A0A5B1LX39_9ACTN|nr:hypothetical protein [Nocardioides antri]KAA1424309.1 hypothetical protein F0U47_18930 [Nocardioides antri]
MAGPIRISVLANASQAKREFGSVADSGQRMGGKFSSIAKGGALALAAGFAIAGKAAIDFGIDAVKAASDAEQSVGATETVFGKWADKVIKDSNRAATEFGLSAHEYRTNANLIGSLFKNQGIATDQLAGKTKGMIRVAADLSATFGGSATDAVQALGSAFKGEFDPLEKYGISIKQSTVSTEANILAQKKHGKSLDDLSLKQQTALKQQATANLITKQSADSTGAFAREADTLAHKQQVMGAQWDNLKVKIGNAFLPVASEAIGWISGTAIPAISDFVNVLRGEGLGGAGGGPLGAIMETVGNNARRIGEVLSQLWDGIQSGWESLQGSVAKVMEKHGPMIEQLAGWFDTLAQNATDVLGPALKWIAEEGLTLVGKAFEHLMDTVKLAGNVFFDFADIVLAVVGPVVGTVGEIVSGVIGHFLNLAEAADAIPGVDMSGTIEDLTGIRENVSSTTSAIEVAAKKWRGDLNEAQWAWNLTSKEAEKLANRIRLLPDEVETKVKTPGLINSFRDVRRLGHEYKLTPDELVTVVEATGTRLTLNQLNRVNKQYDLTPKQVATLVQATGTKTTIGDLKKVLKQADITDKEDIAMVLKTLGVDLSVKEFKKVKDEGDKLNKYVSKPNVAVQGGAGARDTINGVKGLMNELNGDTSHVYIKTHRVTVYETEGTPPRENSAPRLQGEKDGFQYGRAFADAVAKASAGFGLSFFKNVSSGLAAINQALERATAFIQKKINLSNDAKEREREKRVLRNLKDQYKALRDVGAAIDRMKEKISASRERLQRLKEEAKAYSEQIKQSFIDTGNVTTMGQNEDGSASLPNILDQLRDKVVKAQRFAALIRDLTARGLNETTLQQLLAAGPDAGLATAEALATGSQAALDEINSLTGQLTNAGASLGQSMADEFFGDEIADEEKTLDMLLGKLEVLKRKAERRARQLSAAIRRALRGSGSGDDDNNDRRRGRRTAEGILESEERLARMFRRLGRRAGQGTEDHLNRRGLKVRLGIPNNIEDNLRRLGRIQGNTTARTIVAREDELQALMRRMSRTLFRINSDDLTGKMRVRLVIPETATDSVRSLGRVQGNAAVNALGARREELRGLGRSQGSAAVNAINAREDELTSLMRRLGREWAGAASRNLDRASARDAMNATATKKARAETVQLIFQVPPTVNKAEIGREVVSAVQSYYAAGGKRLA